MKRKQQPSKQRKDKRFGFRHVPADTMHGKVIAPRREGGVHDATVLADQEGIRRAIEAQMCPFCERGPFKMLPVHTNKIHGIDKWALRDMAGYSTTDPISSEEARSAMAAAWARDDMRQIQLANAAKGRAVSATKGRKPYRRTKVGTARTQQNLRAWEEAHPEEAQAARAAALDKMHEPTVVSRRATTQRERWAGLSPQERRQRASQLFTPEAQAKMKAAALEANRRPIPEHGNINRYKHHGCRCDPCRAAKADDRRQLKLRRANA